MHLVVLMGGLSPEREISLKTGAAMASAYERLGHRVTTLDLTRDIATRLTELAADCVILALHGVPGEDGTVQGILELLGIPYTGSGVTASALAIDKILTKRVAQGLGIAVAKDVVLRAHDPAAALAAIEAAGLSWPLIVKGNTAGSTLGLKIAHDPSELPHALDVAFAVSPSVLIEERVEGIEISICRLGDLRLPVPQIVSGNEIFDYEAKYTPGFATHIFPPAIDPDLLAIAEMQAHWLYDTIGCTGCGRVDMIITADGTPVMLEVNTLPGMTELSLVPEAAARIGLSFDDVCAMLLAEAIARPMALPIPLGQD